MSEPLKPIAGGVSPLSPPLKGEDTGATGATSDPVAANDTAREAALELAVRNSGGSHMAPTLPALHTSIAGGEFDSANILDEAVDQKRIEVVSLLSSDNIENYARAKLPLSRDQLMWAGVQKRSRETGLSSSQKNRFHFTEFGRRLREWEFIRDVLIPTFKDQAVIKVGNLAPGYQKITPLDRNPYFTFEPFTLAALDTRISVMAYDLSPEVVSAIQNFDGTIYLQAKWLARSNDLASAMNANYGVDWEKIIADQKTFFDLFVASTGAITTVTEMIEGNLAYDYPVLKINFPKGLFKDQIKTPGRPVNFLTEPLEDEQWDLAYFHPVTQFNDTVYGQLPTLIALIRIVQRIKAGGYLVTDPRDWRVWKSRKGEEDVPWDFHFGHSPDPFLMKVLGLEAVADLKHKEFANTPSTIFRKTGPTNEFVRTMSGRIETALAKARGDRGSPAPTGGVRGGGGGVELAQAEPLLETDPDAPVDTDRKASSHSPSTRPRATPLPALGAGRFAPTGRSAFRTFVP